MRTAKSSDRRITRRTPIRVLVRCLPPKTQGRHRGKTPTGWEMWARDIANDGVGLRWSREWAGRRYTLDMDEMDQRNGRYEVTQSPQPFLKIGQTIELDGLIYTEKGSRTLRGRIKWVRASRKGDTLDLGVRVTSPNHRSFFKALEG